MSVLRITDIGLKEMLVPLLHKPFYWNLYQDQNVLPVGVKNFLYLVNSVSFLEIFADYPNVVQALKNHGCQLKQRLLV